MTGASQNPKARIWASAMVAVGMLLTGIGLVLGLGGDGATSLRFALLAGCAALFVVSIVQLILAWRRLKEDRRLGRSDSSTPR